MLESTANYNVEEKPVSKRGGLKKKTDRPPVALGVQFKDLSLVKKNSNLNPDILTDSQIIQHNIRESLLGG